MQYLHTNQELTRRFFNYLNANFSKVQVNHAIRLREHPETKQEMAFLSYRVGNHYVGFEGVPGVTSMVFRTRAREGIAAPLKLEIAKAISSFEGPSMDAYRSFFGNPGFSEKSVIISPNVPGIETIVEIPFNIPKMHPWVLEIFAFPAFLGTFIKPANDILFQKSREKAI